MAYVDVFIDVSEYHPPRFPSKKWRELIKKVWEVDPRIYPHCGSEMKLIALIDDDEVIEKILRHLKLWPEQTALASTITPAGRILDPGNGFRVWFTQQSGTPHGAADVFSGGSRKQFLISHRIHFL
ncbi:MAG: hypothetical protein O2901_15105 [Verrucomicrobia bacterium]|nr:hypothetical protein [Verrucomicrobiota bacterium]